MKTTSVILTIRIEIGTVEPEKIAKDAHYVQQDAEDWIESQWNDFLKERIRGRDHATYDVTTETV